MKTQNTSLPLDRVEIERQGDEAVVTLWDGTYTETEENGVTTYAYNLYQSRHRWRIGLEDAVRVLFDEWYEAAKEAEEHEIAENEIDICKARLNDTDYRIIKCYEYSLAGLDMPYDIAALHTARQELRDKISALEIAL